jgi:hypothetical protein
LYTGSNHDTIVSLKALTGAYELQLCAVFHGAASVHLSALYSTVYICVFKCTPFGNIQLWSALMKEAIPDNRQQKKDKQYQLWHSGIQCVGSMAAMLPAGIVARSATPLCVKRNIRGYFLVQTLYSIDGKAQDGQP